MKWKTVQIPEPLHNEVSENCERYGYASNASFVADAVRRFLEKLAKENNPKKEIKNNEVGI